MELVKKGATAELESIKQLVVRAQWAIKADFDIAALYEARDGKRALIYFNSRGDLNAFPFIKHSGDEGQGDKIEAKGSNEESIRIANLDDIKTVHILVWDYGALTRGEQARFTGSDLKVTITDDKSNTTTAKLDSSDTANVVILATIDNSLPTGAKLINQSIMGVLKDFQRSEQFWALIPNP